MNRTNSIKLLSLLLVAALVGCNMPRNQASPTANITQAYQTVEAHLTEAALTTPVVASPVASPTVSASNTPAPSQTPRGNATPLSLPSPTPTVRACDQAAAGLPKIDVTIDDDTVMLPGQDFTKTWRLQNVGSCTWSKDYSIAVFSGDALSAPTAVPLPSKVDPGQSIDISVDLTAPSKAGTYTGNWKLRNAAGNWFGIGPGGVSPFWVRIVVKSDAVGTITPTVTGTVAAGASPSPTTTTYPGPSTPSANPGVQVSGSGSLALNDQVDLDTNKVNSGTADLALQVNGKGRLQLVLLNGAGFGGMGGAAPAYADCTKLSYSGSAIALKNIPVGTYLCYQTSGGRLGWLQLVSWKENDPTATLQFKTWALP
jgi:hypothetical protein